VEAVLPANTPLIYIFSVVPLYVVVTKYQVPVVYAAGATAVFEPLDALPYWNQRSPLFLVPILHPLLAWSDRGILSTIDICAMLFALNQADTVMAFRL
jgi:hypothetical protein